jgi:hypothetical protein
MSCQFGFVPIWTFQPYTFTPRSRVKVTDEPGKVLPGNGLTSAALTAPLVPGVLVGLAIREVVFVGVRVGVRVAVPDTAVAVRVGVDVLAPGRGVGVRVGVRDAVAVAGTDVGVAGAEVAVGVAAEGVPVGAAVEDQMLKSRAIQPSAPLWPRKSTVWAPAGIGWK